MVRSLKTLMIFVSFFQLAFSSDCIHLGGSYKCTLSDTEQTFSLALTIYKDQFTETIDGQARTFNIDTIGTTNKRRYLNQFDYRAYCKVFVTPI